MVMGPKTEINCAGKGQQQFRQPTYIFQSWWQG
jgi:hypothetical protein